MSGEARPHRLIAGERLVSCHVGENDYALRGDDVRVIARAERMLRQPADDGATGTLTVEGKTIPVYELATALGIASDVASPAPGRGHIVVTVGPQGPAAWLVDRVARLQITDAAEMLPLPRLAGGRARSLFEGLLKIDDRSLLLISTGSLRTHGQLEQAQDLPRAEATPARTGGREAPDVARMIVTFESAGLPPCEAPRYALSARQIAAAVQSLRVMTVPGTRRHVIGIATWRDEVLPILDFRPQADRGIAPDRTRYLVARCGATLGGAPVAFPIDSDVRLYRPAEGDRQIATAQPPPPFVAGIFAVSGARIALLDLDALVEQQ